MSTKGNEKFAEFAIKPWHLLTEIPTNDEAAYLENDAAASISPNTNKAHQQVAVHPYLIGVSAVLIRLLFDIVVYLYSSVSVRMRRLNISGRAFQQAEIEGCEKSFFFKSAAGSTLYLIPTQKTFEALNMPFPYNDAHIEHSYYTMLNCFLLSKNPQYRSVRPGVKLGSSNAISDIVTVGHDGTRQALEITLSTTNILTNARKYESTDFARIVFLCRNYQLREAVKACCREGGLDAGLLAKLDFMHFSQLLQQQRRLSLY